MIMKKILKWFKKRPINKMVIIVSIVTAIVQFIAGNVPLAVSHLLIGLAWIVIDSNDGTIEVQWRTIRILIGDNEDLKGLLDIKTATSEYWFFKFCLERTKVDFCKRKISCSKFIEKLGEFEAMVERAKTRCSESFDAYEKPQG
jgi:hypothetical protein